jgi:hypothetical protein
MSSLRFAGVTVLALTLSLAAACGDDEITGPTGSLRISVTVTGTPTTPSTFRVEVDGEEFDTFGGGGGTSTAEGMPVGDFEVEVVDFAENCTVAGENPRDASVTEGAVATVAFAVTCS